MKFSVSIARLLLFFFAVPGSMGLSRVDTLTVLHLNDTHSTLAPIGPRTVSLDGTLGGIARAATIIEEARTEKPGAPVLVLHAGDFSVGDIFYNVTFGVAELKILAALGVDAMAVGNHEFDLGPSALLQTLDSAFTGDRFPLLSSNLVLADSSIRGLRKYIVPSVVRTIGSRKIGIFGLTTPVTNVLSQPLPAVIDTNVAPIAAATIKALRAEGCDAVICLSHLGIVHDRLLGHALPGIDVIIGGHDHYITKHPEAVVNPAGDTTWIVQANAFYLGMGKIRLAVVPGRARLIDDRFIPLDATVRPDPSVEAVVNQLKSEIEAKYGRVFSRKVTEAAGYFGEVADSLTFRGNKDTPVGNLVTDAFRDFMHTDVAMEAGGSTAQPLYPGPIVADDLFRVVGYGFNTENGLGYHLVKFTMRGDAMLAGLEFGVSQIALDDEFLLQVSGMSYAYDSDKEPGRRIHSVMIGGVPLDPTGTYTITANAFVPMMLGEVGIQYSALHVCAGDTTEFQVLTRYVERFPTLRPVVGGRVRNDPSVAGDQRGSVSRGLK